MGTLTVSGAGRATIPVVVSSVLNDNSWETISKVSQAGQAANYWNVGDTKTIVINGKVGATTFSNLSIDAFIIGIDHNSAIEGKNTIHFNIGKISGIDVALCDSYYGNNPSATGVFSMNTYSSDPDGWTSTKMRKTVLGSDSTATSPTSNTLLAALPSDLRSVMKPLTKYTDNTGGTSNSASYVTATTDYLPLLAEFEVFGSRTNANTSEKNYQSQYDYYKAGNGKTKYQHNKTDTSAYWLLRSPYTVSQTDGFCAVSQNGGAIAAAYNYSCGISPVFAV